MERVTIGVVNYNGKAVLPDTLHCIRNLDYPDVALMVVDDCSTDGSMEWARENYPNFQCLSLSKNSGPNAARSLILESARTEYVLIMDHDVRLRPDALTRLMEAIKRVPDAAIAHPEIKDSNDPHVSHYNGGWIHYMGTLVPPSYTNGERPEHEIVYMASGQALLVRREVALRVGGFDAEYFFGFEDGDFVMRVILAGYRCINVPGAVGHHTAKSRGLSNVYYHVRNRWLFILKLYSWRTLFLAAPMFALHELSLCLLLTMKGQAKQYCRGNLAILPHLPSFLRKRRTFQRMKVLADNEWLSGEDPFVPDAALGGPILGILRRAYSRVLHMYWRAIRRLCG
ncbi:MAG: glycosyltransferase family 2 protein [Dehalococcoidia bacterium]